MTLEELKTLSKKVAFDKATPEEKLLFLKELNELVARIRDDIAKVRQSKSNQK